MSGYGALLSWSAAAATGPSHVMNEDALIAALPVFAVADGMGGHQAGAVASQLAVEALSGLIGRRCESSHVVEAIDRASRAIDDASTADSNHAGMGTTLSGIALVHEDDREVWLVFNVGDSRVYSLTDGSLVRITVDHSLVQELIDAGELTPEEAPTDPRRNVVTRALGSSPPPEVDFWLLSPRPGERFLICSDGLSGSLSESVILELLGGDGPMDEVAQDLVSEAVAAGARDDVSVIVIQSSAVGSAGIDGEAPTVERPVVDEGATIPRARLEESWTP